MDQRKPSGVTDTFWIRAYRHDEEPLPNEMEKVGKWLLFVPEDHLDACWKRVREATVGGQLGISAKTATSKENPLASKQGIKLICVYTEDYEDTTDIFQVLTWLRRLGFTGRLNYKTNEATLEKRYRFNNSGPVSLYTSPPGAYELWRTGGKGAIRSEPTTEVACANCGQSVVILKQLQKDHLTDPAYDEEILCGECLDEGYFLAQCEHCDGLVAITELPDGPIFCNFCPSE